MPYPKLGHKLHPSLNIHLNKAKSLSCDHVSIWPTLRTVLPGTWSNSTHLCPAPVGLAPCPELETGPSIGRILAVDAVLGQLPLLDLVSIRSCLWQCLPVFVCQGSSPTTAFIYPFLSSVLPILDHSLGSPAADRDRPMGLHRKSCLSVAL